MFYTPIISRQDAKPCLFKTHSVFVLAIKGSDKKNTQTGFFNFQLIFLLLKETDRNGLTYARASAGDRFWRQ